MADLIIPSLLPEDERREWERRQRLKRRWTPPPEPPVKKQISLISKIAVTPPPKKTALTIEPNADLIWRSDYEDSFQLLKLEESNGISTQMPGPLGRDRELVLGLDFGTSCVKVVVGDRGASKAYAVPFLDAPGINTYLLPSRLFEQDGVLSLSSGTKVHRDLKLQFLANPKSNSLQELLVGFLALVIRRCRAWLFSVHADILIGRNILWKLVMGRAVDREKNDYVSRLMSQLLNAAWSVAGGPEAINRLACGQELARNKSDAVLGEDLPEILIVPELAAQIYGFVSSRQFDPRAKNFYLIVDVGAGTVDTSLFGVKLNEYGGWDFALFTSVVEPNGVINLHRYRLNWWRQQLERLSGNQCKSLIKKIDDIKSPTEQMQPIPEKYLGYFKGIDALYTGGARSPDDMFYMSRLIPQVRGQGIQRTVQQKIVGQGDLNQLPFFLCGGGARLPLYKNIESALSGRSEFKWLKSQRRELGIPSELDAPGLAQSDYDRLSVAFGLSFVDVGKVVIAQAMPKITQKTKVDWRSGYVDKDGC